MGLLDKEWVYIVDLTNRRVLDLVPYSSVHGVTGGWRRINPNIVIGVSWKNNLKEKLK